MVCKHDLTATQLKLALHYDPETGVFVRLAAWKQRPSRRDLFGKLAGAIMHQNRPDKYIAIRVFGRSYFAHRLAWLYMTGEWPRDLLDHINGVGTDNRFVNLRAATVQENSRNTRPRQSAIGLKGVRPNGPGFSARIGVNGQRLCLGTFKTADEAHAAYCAAAQRFFGEYRRTA